MSWLSKIQNKSRLVRIQILWLSVILTMIIVLALWLVFLSHSLSLSTAGQPDSQIVEKVNESIPSVWQTIKEDFSSLKEYLGAMVSQIESVDQNQSQNGELEFEIIK